MFPLVDICASYFFVLGPLFDVMYRPLEQLSKVAYTRPFLDGYILEASLEGTILATYCDVVYGPLLYRYICQTNWLYRLRQRCLQWSIRLAINGRFVKL